jgi:Flp pilus assembly protein TadD
MLRRLLGTTLAGVLLTSVPTGCGGSGTQVKSSSTKSEHGNLLLEARNDAKAGDIESADKAYAAAYEIGKELPILEERIAFLVHAGRARRAENVSKLFYDAHTSDPHAYALYTEALIANHKGQEALEVADQLLELRADDPVGHERKGRALMLLERTQEGIEQLRIAVSLDPKSAQMHLSLGTALYEDKQLHEAALELRTALKYAPDDSMVCALLGMALREQNELKESRHYIDKAIALDPDNGRAYYELALLLNTQRKRADAEVEQALSKAVQKSPNDSRFWYAYGEIYRLQNRRDAAMNAYTRAVDLDPPHPKAIAKLGILLVAKKEWKEAEAVLTRAARRDPKNPGIYFHLGAVYAATRRDQIAIENFQKFLELARPNDPDRWRAQDAIKELKRRR